VIVDYHMHLRNARGEIAHDTSAVEPFVESAREAGVDEIGFTEHIYYFRQTRSLWTVPYHTERCVYDIEAYVSAVVGARSRGLPVKLGLEVDYVRGREEETRELLAPYPWDFLLGSLHNIDDLSVDDEPRLVDAVGVDEAWRVYFETLAAAARSGLFESLSHPDLVKIFGARPASFDYGPVVGAIADSVLGATLQARRRCDTCNRETERLVHDCGAESRAVRGLGWMDNDIVNFLSGALGGLLAALLSR